MVALDAGWKFNQRLKTGFTRFVLDGILDSFEYLLDIASYLPE